MLVFTGSNKNAEYFYKLFVQMVKDLENTRFKYHGYSYVRTMRNILIANQNAVIAVHFQDKPYYGIFSWLSLGEVEAMMDRVVSTGQLEIVWTDHGKLYCTPDYHNYLCRKTV